MVFCCRKNLEMRAKVLAAVLKFYETSLTPMVPGEMANTLTKFITWAAIYRAGSRACCRNRPSSSGRKPGMPIRTRRHVTPAPSCRSSPSRSRPIISQTADIRRTFLSWRAAISEIESSVGIVIATCFRQR